MPLFPHKRKAAQPQQTTVEPPQKLRKVTETSSKKQFSTNKDGRFVFRTVSSTKEPPKQTNDSAPTEDSANNENNSPTNLNVRANNENPDQPQLLPKSSNPPQELQSQPSSHKATPHENSKPPKQPEASKPNADVVAAPRRYSENQRRRRTVKQRMRKDHNFYKDIPDTVLGSAERLVVLCEQICTYEKYKYKCNRKSPWAVTQAVTQICDEFVDKAKTLVNEQEKLTKTNPQNEKLRSKEASLQFLLQQLETEEREWKDIEQSLESDNLEQLTPVSSVASCENIVESIIHDTQQQLSATTKDQSSSSISTQNIQQSNEDDPNHIDICERAKKVLETQALQVDELRIYLKEIRQLKDTADQLNSKMVQRIKNETDKHYEGSDDPKQLMLMGI